jgi:PAS domain S-box-containing protein
MNIGGDIFTLIKSKIMLKFYNYLLVLIIFICIAVTLYVNLVMGTDVVYTHLYYIPVILVGLWYYRKAVYLAVFLGVAHIFIAFINAGHIVPDTFIRAGIFLVVAFVVGYLSEYKDQYYNGIRMLLESTDEGIYGVDTKGRNTFINKAALQMLGYSQDEVIGKNIQDLIYNTNKEDRRYSLEKNSVVRSLRSGVGGRNSDDVFWKKDGTSFPVEYSSNPMVQNDKVTGTVVTFTDITERKRADEALRESEEKFIKVFYANPAAMSLSDEEGRYIDANESFSKLIGYSKDELIGHTSIELNITNPERGNQYLTELQEKGANKSQDLEIYTKSGKKLITNTSSISIELRGKINYISFIYDITDLRRAEEELLAEKMQAELYLDLMGHDISNMHQIIVGQLELAQEIFDVRGRLEGDDRDMIDTSVKTLQRSALLIDNIRNIQKLRSGEYKFERMDLGDVLGDAVQMYSKLPDRDITIDYVPAHGFYLVANPLLKDIIVNLLDNAVKHCSDPVRINVNASRVDQNGNSFYQVIVEDNGRGVPDDKKADIFNRLKRGQTKARGTGLGLYIVKTLVEGFGGSVSIADRVPGDHTKGARFVVMLPAAEK